MKIVFVSNYINHHQIPFCEAMRTQEGVDFTFVQTEKIEEERLQMGWKDVSDKLSYVVRMYDDPKAAQSLILQCDILLAGWAPAAEEVISTRLIAGLPTFRLSERIYKDGQWKAVSPRGLLMKHRQFTRFADKPYYLLCAGAYVGSDYALIHAFPEKKFRWGYFPPLFSYMSSQMEELKEEGRKEAAAATGSRDAVEVTWAGRFVDFKHPETIFRLAKDLAAAGVRFHLNVAGGGDKEDGYRAFLQENGLEKVVTIHGLTSPETVRKIMEKSAVFILTSDHGEGWGAVVNEAMNSGCAVIAGAEAGCVPYLVKPGVTGMIVNGTDYQDLYEKTRYLLEHPDLQLRYGKAGYRAVQEVWNAETAARRLAAVCRRIMAGEDIRTDLPGNGPMSVDPCLKPFLKVPRL